MDKTIVLTKNNVRIYVSDLTNTSNEAIKRHSTLPFPSIGIATAISVFGPLGVMKKYGRIVATIKGDGAFKNIIVESKVNGDIRALIGNSNVATEYDNDIEKINSVPLQIGIGNLGTLKILNVVSGNNFGGEVKLAKGDIVTDLAWYFDQSEQIQSAVISSVKLIEKGKLSKSWGAIFQMMPGYTETDIKFIEEFIRNNKMESYSSIDEWSKRMGAKKINEISLRWKCSCSVEKIKQLLNAISEYEKKEIIKETGKLEIICNFCSKKYDFSK